MEHNFKEVEFYIKEHLDKPISLQQLADVACLSPIHFSRSFKEQMGHSPVQFAEFFKIRESLELIKQMDYKIRDIAFLLGYNNYETFTRRFKSLVKIAPSDLQYILKQVSNEVDPKAPTVISGTEDIQDLQYLVNDALERNDFTKEDLADLHVCLLSVSNQKSRKIQERINYHFKPALARQLRQLYNT